MAENSDTPQRPVSHTYIYIFVMSRHYLRVFAVCLTTTTTTKLLSNSRYLATFSLKNNIQTVA